jgi:ribosome biogenesis GTPase
MTKRKLNDRQTWRVQKIQEERLRRAERQRERAEASFTEDRLGPEQHGLVVANYGASVAVEDAAGASHRCVLRQNLELAVVGDRVVWQPGSDGGGVVTAVVPRQTTLARPDVSGQLKPVAANVDQVLVVAAPLPLFSAENVDRFVVAAELSGMTPALVFNKADLIGAADRPAMEAALARYRAIGYAVVYTSTRTGLGLDEVRALLGGHTSIFAGQSGVGKSSLVNALLPEAAATVGDLAQVTGLGRHTTTAARLYHLPNGGRVIDSPGVREFRLWTMDPQELAMGFREFGPHLGHCRFRDCRHEGEPGCALLAAVKAGAIAPERVASYKRIAAEMAERAPTY